MLIPLPALLPWDKWLGLEAKTVRAVTVLLVVIAAFASWHMVEQWTGRLDGTVAGWGGWWFWDPVENVSLVPWLAGAARSGEHTSELQSLMRISYAVFCLKKKKQYRQLETRRLKL